MLGKFVAATYHLSGALKDEDESFPSFGCPAGPRATCKTLCRPSASATNTDKHPLPVLGL